MRVVFAHPDLGIGGAERVVLDAAIALQQHGHDVIFVTGHHDTGHCFEETKDGSLHVVVVGDWIPRSVLGRCFALCAYLRMVYLAFYVVLARFFMPKPARPAMSGDSCTWETLTRPDVVFCDQISVAIPVFKLLSNAKILFYCHFPDQLLSKHDTSLKRFYRAPLDFLEEWSTGCADRVLVNSGFTASVFRDTFLRLASTPLQVLYPSLNTKDFDSSVDFALTDVVPEERTKVFLSINRYEGKKNVRLAVEALGYLAQELDLTEFKKVHLVIAGGFDPRVDENRIVHQELVDLVQKFDEKYPKFASHVTFLKSCSFEVKRGLLSEATALLYTPEGEHFGIVPIEAMYSSTPVIAVESGGPMETVKNGETGFLVQPTGKDFADAMRKFIQDENLSPKMGRAAKLHVEENFGFEAFGGKLDEIVKELCFS